MTIGRSTKVRTPRRLKNCADQLWKHAEILEQMVNTMISFNCSYNNRHETVVANKQTENNLKIVYIL